MQNATVRGGASDVKWSPQTVERLNDPGLGCRWLLGLRFDSSTTIGMLIRQWLKHLSKSASTTVNLKGKQTVGKLQGKVAVLTAATSGMALASAKLFAREGAFVFITGRDQARMDKALAQIGGQAEGIIADSSVLTDLDRLFETVKERKGKVDVLFASAGTSASAPIGRITEEDFDKTFDLNVRGTLFTIQKALPLFADGGSIILNGSVALSKGVPGGSVYAGSKAALRAFARSWLVDLKERGIRVNVLSPGPIDTPLLRSYGAEAASMYASKVPRGTVGSEQEIATAALFLASSDSSFVNGSELAVDGGLAQI